MTSVAVDRLAGAAPARAPGAAGEIVVEGLTKRFGSVLAVDDLSFRVEPGHVCGFLGPNGAGKTTTLRCLLGLVAPTSGSATIDGVPYVRLDAPMSTVGAVLDSSSFHPGRTARNHLRVIADAAGFPGRRVDEVLDLAGLQLVADRRVGGYSTGMRQRLGLAAALLGDPEVFVLDEPSTGLDPAGINWLRDLLGYLAHDRNRTVLLSSHLLGEMQEAADHIVIIANGRLVQEGSLDDLLSGTGRVRVRSPQLDRLTAALRAAGATVEADGDAVTVRRLTAAEVGHLAFQNRIEVEELTSVHDDLEDVFLALTHEGSHEEGPAP